MIFGNKSKSAEFFFWLQKQSNQLVTQEQRSQGRLIHRQDAEMHREEGRMPCAWCMRRDMHQGKPLEVREGLQRTLPWLRRQGMPAYLVSPVCMQWLRQARALRIREQIPLQSVGRGRVIPHQALRVQERVFDGHGGGAEAERDPLGWGIKGAVDPQHHPLPWRGGGIRVFGADYIPLRGRRHLP